MNIFYFDHCPIISAQAQPDKLLVKMPLESAQMLSACHRILDGDEYADQHGLYKKTHANHPCTIWARQTTANYRWLYCHFIALSNEYTERYERQHLSYSKLKYALAKPPENLPFGELTQIAQAMPDKYRNVDPIKAYRDYVVHEKHYAEWNKMPERRPDWWVEFNVK
tara:strand:+ start:2329 stop:2829 length:501 start_codon:yes stop_codon:yes gene_type:complete